MGTLYYGAARTPVAIDDRQLAHLRLVTTSKLRRHESFLLSWDQPLENGGGRGSLFVHPQCDLVFRFDGSRPAELDPDLLEAMATAALSSRGLVLEAMLPATAVPA
jgi:hypothetical protein